MEVSDCANGREAARAWCRKAPSFDVAVIDLLMPGMDGYELALQLRRLPATVETCR